MTGNNERLCALRIYLRLNWLLTLAGIEHGSLAYQASAWPIELPGLLLGEQEHLKGHTLSLFLLEP